MSKFLDKRLQQTDAYTPGEQPRDIQYIKLNTNESPYPPAPEVLKAVSEKDIANLRLYSDPTCKVLKEKLAGLYGVKPQNIFVSNGSDDILNFAFLAFGRECGAVFPDISYGFYSVFAQLHGVEYSEIPLKEDFTVDYKDYLGINKFIAIANPNAPTGISLPLWQIEEIVKSNPENVVLIDEAYVDFGGESCYKLTEKYDNLLVVRTFSKSRCLAGGRLGYAFGCKELIEDIEKIKYSTNPYNINRLTLSLGEATVDNDNYYREKCAEIIRTRDKTKSALENEGFTVLNSNTNFLFAKSPDISGEKLYLELKSRGILVRHFSKERVKDFNRITIGTPQEMDHFVKAVKEILSGGKK